MKIFDKKIISAVFITLLLLVCVFASNQNKSYALTNLNVPEITNFAKSPIESDAIRIDLKSNNTGSNYSYEIINVTTGESTMLSGSATNYTFQNLEPGVYKVQIKACTTDVDKWSCSGFSPEKSFELKEEEEPEIEDEVDTTEEVEEDPDEGAEFEEEELDPVIAAKLSTTSYVYNGKAKKPSVTVTEDGEKLTNKKDYKVTYPKGRKSIGTYTVTIKGAGDYSFTIKLNFVINPPATKIKSKSAKKTSITAKFTSKKGGVKYQLGYKKSSASTYSTANSSSTKKTISKLSKNTTYNLKVRTYKVVKNKTYYSAWSSVTSIKTKK